MVNSPFYVTLGRHGDVGSSTTTEMSAVDRPFFLLSTGCSRELESLQSCWQAYSAVDRPAA